MIRAAGTPGGSIREYCVHSEACAAWGGTAHVRIPAPVPSGPVTEFLATASVSSSGRWGRRGSSRSLSCSLLDGVLIMVSLLCRRLGDSKRLA